MSREIKFRAWDGKRMVFFDTLEIGFKKSKKTIPQVFFKNDTFNGEVRLGRHEVMQYTGFLDVDKKDIYESDVIESTDMYGPYKGVIEWLEDRWCLCYKGHVDGSKQYQSLMTVKNPKKIGDIHQNPDLL